MFTGIIEAVGRVQSVVPKDGDVRLRIDSAALNMQDVQLGDSIATNGICLTVVDFGANWYAADVSTETLKRTTLGTWTVGTPVNLEKALLPTTRLGGHLVSGHVDGVGHVVLMRQEARSMYVEVRAPEHLAKYLAAKGSITVDGISLTINQVNGAVLSLNLVPHTAVMTNIQHWAVHSVMNLEVDILARYLERLLLGDKAAQPQQPSGINADFLKQHGFM